MIPGAGGKNVSDANTSIRNFIKWMKFCFP